MHRRGARRFVGLSLSLVALFLLAADAAPDSGDNGSREKTRPSVQHAADAPPNGNVGRLVRVPLPVIGNADTQVKRTVQKALSELPAGDDRPVIVLEFGSGKSQTGQGSDFSRALALARYLSSRELSKVKTVAYLPRTVNGHAVLVAMACEEIVMAPEAEIGQAGIDEPAEEPIDPTVRSGYAEIANRRRTIPAQVALGMLDKNVEVLKVETELSPEFILSDELDALKQKHTIQNEQVLSRPGQFAEFTGREARELGFVKYLAADRNALARALSLRPTMLEDDPSLAGDWRPVRIPIKGPITTQLASRVQRMIDDQIRGQDANFVCLWIDSPGGSLEGCMTLANYLADLDPAKVRTVAYVPAEARSDAALIAMACDQLVIAPGAILGGAGAVEIAPDEVLLARETLRDRLAPAKGRSWSLIAALVDPDTRVYRYTHKGNGAVDYFCDAELARQADPEAWARGEEVTTPGRALRLKGEQAQQLGLARDTVEDFAEFKKIYGLEHELVLAEPSWAHFLVDWLAQPAVAWLLLLIGGAALYAELQAPGIGIGGFVGGVCFLLYFWSKYLGGTADWLEVMLFAAGVSCVLLEVFVLPGTAIFGLGGGLLIIASLVLASQTFVLPHNDYQLAQLRDSMLGLIGVGVGIVAMALVMRHYLPYVPLFNHVMLEPPTGAELEDISHRESIVDFNHLLGQEGVATTQLTPSGKARFGNQLLDVIADGEVLGRGAEVVVVEVQGNRVVVRSVSG